MKNQMVPMSTIPGASQGHLLPPSPELQTPAPSEFESWLAGRQFLRRQALQEAQQRLALGAAAALYEERRKVGRCPLCASRYAPSLLEKLFRKPWCDECEEECRNLKSPVLPRSAAQQP